MEPMEERIVIKNLILDEGYFSKVFPFLSEKHFTENHTKKLFECIKKFNETYNKQPTLPVLKLFVEKVKGVSASVYGDMTGVIDFIEKEEQYEEQWLLDSTLDFIHNREYYNAMTDAITKYEKNELDTELPERISNALSITFDSSIGMEFSNAEARWDAYTLHEDKVPFLVDKFNFVTKGGVTRKTLNCLMSSNTGGFKSGTLCSFTSDYIRQGYNVLYLTFEMAEDKILERIDANLLDVNIDDIINLGKERYINRINTIKSKSNGRLIVKQYPTSMVHVGHIRNLLNELKLKSRFIPDVIIFDYLGIMSSQRYSSSGAAEHQIIKAATEEVRGLCVEYNCVGWTAMQSNRGGADKGQDLSVSDISASYGAAYGFDAIFALVTSEEFDKEGKIFIKQIKNRYGDVNVSKTFFLGLCKPKMKVYNLLDENLNFSNSSAKKEETVAQAESAKPKEITDVFSTHLATPSAKVKETKFVFS